MFNKKSKVDKLCLLFSILILTSMQVASQVNLQWLNRYNPLIDGGVWTSANYMHLDIDDEGSVYICGPSHDYTYGSDIVTIKYSANGNQIWTSRYDSGTPTNYLSDSPLAMVVDHDKNVIIAGKFQVLSGPTYGEALLIKYLPDGDTLWTRRFKEDPSYYNLFRDVLVDNNNNIYVTGLSCMSTADYECVTIKFDESGNQIWIAKYDYFDTQENVDEICFDPSGNYFYMTAHTGYISSVQKLIKYDCATGDTIWSRTCPSVGYGNIITDQSGNIYVSSIVSQAYPNNGDMALVKYTPTGELLWFETYGCPGYGSDTPRDIKIDDDNNVYVTGMSNLYATLYTQGDPNWTTIKYDPSGEVKWSRFYNRGYPDPWTNALPCTLEFDESGNVLVAGYASEKNLLTSDYTLLKYDKETGATLDTYFYYNISGGSQGDLPNAMAIDNSGNIIITGTMWTPSTSTYDFGTMKLSPLENNSSLTIEHDSLYLPISDSLFTSDTIVVNTEKYMASGFEISGVRIGIDSVYHSNDADLEFYLIHDGITVTLIYCEGDGFANFKGTFLDDSSPLEFSEGTAPYWGTYKPASALSAFNGSNPEGEWILKIYDNTSGNTGALFGWKLNLKMSLITGFEPVIKPDSQDNLFLQNYPNPFTGSTVISWQLPEDAHVVLKVYDFTGRELKTLVDSKMAKGEQKVTFTDAGLPPGVCFYQLQADGRVETKKMLIVK